jgi:hypothetical protein
MSCNSVLCLTLAHQILLGASYEHCIVVRIFRQNHCTAALCDKYTSVGLCATFYMLCLLHSFKTKSITWSDFHHYNAVCLWPIALREEH